MNIAFVHPHRSFLPEIDAYRSFFEALGSKTKTLRPGEVIDPEFQVEWHFMGMQTKRNRGKLVIHEYTSASVPPLASIKDLFKKKFNARPDFRVFLSEYVRDSYSFADGIPFGFRNCGIVDTPFPPQRAHETSFDFVYVGNIDKNRNLAPLLSCFTNGEMKEKTLLIISRDYDSLRHTLRHHPNISFKGPFTQQETYACIRDARFAINFMPDKEPFNKQTSAKFIDYAACQTPIVTSDYPWVREFQKKWGGNYFFLNKDLSNFSWAALKKASYDFPYMKEWTWDHQIRNSGVPDYLRTRFPEFNF